MPEVVPILGGTLIRVVIVDDQSLVRAGFRMVLSSQQDMAVVGEAGDGAEALRLLAHTPADVVVMDIRMPVMDGVEATRRLCVAETGPRVLVLTTFDTDEDAFAALQAGASGFLLKNVPPEELLAAIRVVASGESVVAPRITRRLLDRFAGQLAPPQADGRLAALTEREREVLLLLSVGQSNREIADRLVVTLDTVKKHLTHIFGKLGAVSRTQAVARARALHLVD